MLQLQLHSKAVFQWEKKKKKKTKNKTNKKDSLFLLNYFPHFDFLTAKRKTEPIQKIQILP